MENLLFYFLKVNAILILFYGIYYILLRKETFFQANRMYLLGGIVSAFVLPLLSYSKTIWVEPTSINYDDLSANGSYSEEIVPLVETTSFDWNYLLILLYGLIVTILLAKLAIEVISFVSVIKNGNKNKVNKVVLVETSLFENPFSFFNYLVYNKSAFTEEELEFILTHESIHIKQLHSIDVLVSKLVSLLLWINPIAWLYRKAMLQNLEFIADAETTKELQNSYSYQKTLLKSVCNQNQLSITNQFYQSLIKKRIVMLNTNPSNKRNVWKYSVILPMLVAFFLLYQVKTVAQVKESKIKTETQEVSRVEFIIDKNTSDSQIKEETDMLKKDHDVTVKVSKIKRNSQQEITGLKIDYKDSKGNKGTNQVNGDEPISPIVFFFETRNGKNTMGLTSLPAPREMKRMVFHSDGDEVIDIEVDSDVDWVSADGENVFIEKVKGPQKKIFISNENGKQEKKIIFIDDVEVSEIEMNELNPEVIKQVNVLKNNNGKNVIKIVTKNSNGISEDTEIYINGVKSTKADLDAIEKEHIEMVNVKNLNNQKVIEIQKKVMKEVDEKMQKMNYNFEWNDEKGSKIDLEKRKAQMEKQMEEMEKRKAEMIERKVEMEKMKAELAKTKAEVEKLKEELKKNK